ncbi:hypothetical protein [Kordiimonas marina]|uniref:hypothetical protein n=1 Tax=Kordiimonas marina TaxID=2872312 RepID=UPI001FF689BF|nr:hypothetical protein [Kordiimonas marina]MCJ9428293.1 hypothetical protein [Kordiimonas marina]
MRSLTKLKAVLGLVPLAMLAACVGGPSPSAMGPGPTRAASPAVQSALCEGRADDAIKILSSEPLAAPSDQFYKALAYETGGQPIVARKLYAELMNAGYQGNVSLRCGNDYLANGTISDEAGRHLAMIAQQLQAMDVAAAPMPTLGNGLPSMSSMTSSHRATVRHTSSHAMTVTRPASQSPLGRWFVHLASYRSLEHAKANKPTLEKMFPALAGILDQWEVDVHGFAVRLGVRLNDHQEAENLCQSIKAQGQYCAVLDTQK